MKFFVNFLSVFRILAAFAIIPMLMFQMHMWVFILFVVAALSDFFDGWLAKKYKATSKLGGVLDHIGDKLLVINVMIMLAIMMPIWFIIVPIILMVAREIYISGLREFLGTQKIEMPVPKARFSMAKIKTTLQMVVVGTFLLIFAIAPILAPHISNGIVVKVIYALQQIGIWGLWLALLASLWSAAQYTVDFAQKIKKLKK